MCLLAAVTQEQHVQRGIRSGMGLACHPVTRTSYLLAFPAPASTLPDRPATADLAFP
jgi:hypothetical protein